MTVIHNEVEKIKKINNVLLMAAGTGGHIFPALAVGQLLQTQGVHVSWLATSAGMEHRLVPRTGISLYPIDIQGIRGNGIARLLLAPFKIIAATIATMHIMRRLDIDVVAGFGGYVSGPGGIAARLLGIPLVIHEQNAVAGFTNKQLSRFASSVLQAFPSTFPDAGKIHTTGNPVRAEICNVALPEQRFAGRIGAINILVIGGSLGAEALNKNIAEALKKLVQALPDDSKVDIHVTHQCGQKQLDSTREKYNTHAIAHVKSSIVAFIDDMAAAYADADLIICRAGALTVSEVATVGVPAVFIPLPSAVDDHQTANAAYLCDAGAAVLCPQSSLNPSHLAEILSPLMNREVLLEMAKAARHKAMSNATHLVVEQILAH